MKRLAIMLMVVCFGLAWSVQTAMSEDSVNKNALFIIQGKIEDSSGNSLGGSDVEVYLDGKQFRIEEATALGNVKIKKHHTGRNGLFVINVHAPPETILNGSWAIKATKTSFRTSSLVPVSQPVDHGITKSGQKQFSGHVDVTLQRIQGPAFWLALAILIGVYILISLELVHRTLAALIGAAAILTITHTIGHFNHDYQLLTFEQSLDAVDWNVIFLLMGMMVIVGVLKESGVFQWLAYKSFQLSKGRVFLLAASLCAVTAFLSAFLDNVTTMLLLTPVTIEISLVLGISPFALLIPEIMASNFGGTATLIGDPPNIMIGSYAGLSFNDFLVNLTPVVLITMVAQILYTKWYYGKDFSSARVEDVEKTIVFLREKYKITNMKLLFVGGTVLLGVILLFILHGFFHMEVSVAALLGAALIVFLNKTDIVHTLENDVEWPSLVFFIMLFIIVGAADETGILQFVANWLKDVSAGNLVLAILLILWTSAILSAIVDNIPFTATMLPVVAVLSKSIPGAETGVLWWALALGACFGGNGTIIGASANVITTGIAEKAGYKISFIDFLKHGAPITAVSLIFASVYLLLVMK
ncbi:MAG: ArsB/NhaD family transporter [Syntrophaceae bacterium]|nr:ArsB/NhaD family transporter [Syntrophaceae bacterium]